MTFHWSGKMHDFSLLKYNQNSLVKNCREQNSASPCLHYKPADSFFNFNVYITKELADCYNRIFDCSITVYRW